MCSRCWIIVAGGGVSQQLLGIENPEHLNSKKYQHLLYGSWTFYWNEGRHCNRSPFKRLTGHNILTVFSIIVFPFFYFLNFSFSLVSIFLIEGFTQFKNLSSRSLSERPLAYCKTSMAILQPHGGQCGFWASVALQSVQCCRRWVSTSDTSRLVLFFFPSPSSMFLM